MKDITAETATLMIAGLTIGYSLILLPLTCYYTRKLYKLNHQNIPFFTKRHPNIVIATIICINIYCIIVGPAIFFASDHPEAYIVVLSFSNIFQIVIVLVCIRLWLLYYDYSYSVYSLSLKWKTQMEQEISTPWIIRYKWLGDPKIVIIFGIAISGLFISIVVLSTLHL